MKFTLCFAIMILAAISPAQCAGPVPVRIEATDTGYQLVRDGRPYFVKGAGASDHISMLAEAGANSLRTWGTDQTEALIDIAHEHGLTVTAGLWIEHERHHFDYNDEAAVAVQIARHRRAVDRFKDHPALLAWAVGNEVWIGASNERVWDTIEAIASYIKQVDPYHPVMTVLPHVSAEEVRLIKSRCPSVDILGFNSYGGIAFVAEDARRYGWDGPYMITEWGPDGAWEVEKTDWGAEFEASSTEKADQLASRYELITRDPDCLGSYVFFWGQKQETTPTWFNLFLENGSPLEGVDTLQFLWKGSYPQDRAPRISALEINGKVAEANLIVTAGQKLTASFDLLSPNPDDITVRWECLPESTDKREGGDREARPESIDILPKVKEPETITFAAPTDPGPYRLFLYVHSPNGKAATANFPFLVK